MTWMGRRTLLGVVVAVGLALLLSSCGGGSRPDDPADTTLPGASAATGSSSATGASADGGSTGSTGATAPQPSGGGATGSEPATDLEDGRHFGYVVAVDPAGASLRFDLASFYTGPEANDVAAARGDETPVPNDYYIVNDNPRLRELSISEDVEISVFDWNRCCDVRVDVDATTLADAIAHRHGVVVDGALVRGGSPFWITLEHGVVTRVEEQYLP
jgi:hypothetical protein